MVLEVFRDSHIVLVHEDASITLVSVSDGSTIEWTLPLLSVLGSLSLIYARVVKKCIFLSFKTDEGKIYTQIVSILEEDNLLAFDIIGSHNVFSCDSESLIKLVVGDELKMIIAVVGNGMYSPSLIISSLRLVCDCSFLQTRNLWWLLL
jgi:hypothetical protein